MRQVSLVPGQDSRPRVASDQRRPSPLRPTGVHPPTFRRPRLKWSVGAVVALLPLGLLFPTSVEGELANSLLASADIILLTILLFLLVRPGGYSGGKSLVNSAAILLILFVCTVLSPLEESSYLSSGGPYLLAALVFALCLRNIRPRQYLFTSILFLTNITVITVGLLTYIRTDFVHAFLIAHYSAFTPGLIESMLQDQKPVFSFVTHSIAGFAYCLLFYVNWQTWQRRGRHAFLIFSLLYLLLEILLQSFTAYVATLIIIAVILHKFTTRRILVALLAILICALGVSFMTLSIKTDELLDDIFKVVNSEHNGILGRYTGNGTVVLNLRYIYANPFRPIGLRYSRDLWIVSDSGLIEHMTRGSLPLVVAMYGGLWMFLRNNLYLKQSRRFLFILFMGFEAGFSNLLYFRTLCLLPFVVVYLNSLETNGNAPATIGYDRRV